MSAKEHFIHKLRKARSSHLNWLNKIKLMVSGITVDKESVALNQSESPFGVWLYEDAFVFAVSNSKNVLQEIEKLHRDCFEHYFKIYHTLDKSGGSLIGNMFGSKKPSSSDLMLAQKFYEELVVTSDALIAQLRLFESQMLATPDAKFTELLLEDEPEEPKVDLIAEPAVKSNVQRMYRGQPVD